MNNGRERVLLEEYLLIHAGYNREDIENLSLPDYQFVLMLVQLMEAERNKTLSKSFGV